MFFDTVLGSRVIYVFTAFSDISYFIKVNKKLQVPVTIIIMIVKRKNKLHITPNRAGSSLINEKKYREKI